MEIWIWKPKESYKIEYQKAAKDKYILEHYLTDLADILGSKIEFVKHSEIYTSVNQNFEKIGTIERIEIIE